MTSAQVLYVVQSANYVSMAASAAVVYDQVLTFSQEVDLIWRRRWSLTTVLYLVARYSGTISVILATAGTVFLNWGYNGYVAQFIIGVWAINIFATAMDAILLMRAYALSSRSKAVLIFLSLCFFFQTVVVMVITGMEINVPNTRKFVTFIGGPIGSVTQDIETDASVFLPSPVIVTAAQLAYDMIVFLFALSAFWKHALEARGLAGRWNVNPLAKLLIRDQIFYFFCYVVWQALDIPVDAPGIPQSQVLNIIANALDALVIIAGPRMVISLRAQETKLIDGTDQTEMSTIHFGAKDPPVRTFGEEESGREEGPSYARARSETGELLV